MWVYVGYCMDLVLHDEAEALKGLWQHTIWYFPHAAPGRAQLPFWPITLRPCCLVLLRSNPASMKMNSWGCAAPSMAKILCKKKPQHITTVLHIQDPTPSHRYLCSSPNGFMWYWYGTYSAAAGFHQYCKCKGQLHFDPDPVPLKWDPVDLLHGDVFSQDASDGGDAHMVYVVEHLPVCKYFLS